MELENSQNNALAKLPMLKLGEYEMWEIRIKQYFQIQDYALWEVIENGNSWNDVKARSLLLMALPNEHQLTFNQYVDAQSMLKILFVDWTILGVDTPPEDLNVKFLRSLPSEWDTHVVKRTAAVNNDDKNLAFLTTSSPSIYAFLSTQPQGSQLVYEDLEQLHDDDLEEMDLKWNMALLSMRTRKFYQRTGRKIIIDGSKLTGYDKSKVECSSSKAVKIEDASEKAMCAIDGAGFDWSDMAEDEIQANMALMAFTDSEKQYDDLLVKLDDTGFKAATYKRGLSILKAQVVKYKESEVLFSEEIALLKRSVGHKEYLKFLNL
ncbi:hypothetical protein Tco_0228017 [Tanacetum coccineum]